MYSTCMWLRCESFDNVAVDEGALCVMLLLLDEITMNSVPICFQSTSKGGLVQSTFNLHRPKPNSSVKGHLVVYRKDYNGWPSTIC